MKKVGRILFCAVPFLLAFSIQFLISIPMIGISFLSALIKVRPDTSFDLFMNDLANLWMDSSFTAQISLFYAIATIIVFGFWYQKRFQLLDVKHIPSHFNGKIILGIFLLVPGLQYLTTYLISVVSAINPQWLKSYESLMETAGLTDVTPVLACYAVLLGPISEELIYRGITMTYAKREMPFFAANFLQALSFGFYHMNILQGIYAFFVGLFLGYVCHKTKSIFPSILLHILFNLWGTFANEFFMYGIDTPFFFILWLIVGILLTVFGMLCICKGSVPFGSGSKNDASESSDQ